MKKILLSLILTQLPIFASGGDLPENKTTVPAPIMFDWESLSTPFPQVKIESVYDAYRKEWIEYIVPIEEDKKIMKNFKAMDKVVYLGFCFVILSIVGFVILTASKLSLLYKGLLLPPVLGGMGSTTYCMRAIYIHQIQLKNHDKRFDSWLYLRPFVGVFRGLLVAFIGATLLILAPFLVAYTGRALFLLIIGLQALIEGYKPMITRFGEKYGY